jgi:magnesium chelatase accessory protein
MFERDRLNLESDGDDWPLREHSRMVKADGLDWHVQVMGEGPVLLLLHGTGASTHSWRDLMPDLAQAFTVIAPDLPGHGFSGAPMGYKLTLNGMARGVSALMRALDLSPQITVGHSAGAAVAIWAALEGQLTPKAIIALNGALLPFKGASGFLFPTIARLLFVNPFMPRMFAKQSSTASVRRLIERTGSDISDDGIEYYRRLMANPGHCAAALGMMANWDLRPMGRLWDRLEVPLHLVVGMEDEAVEPEDADAVAAKIKGAEIHRLDGLGHLAHEEDPARVAALIREIAAASAA